MSTSFAFANAPATADILSSISFNVIIKYIVIHVALYATTVTINFTEGAEMENYLTCQDIAKMFNVKLRTVYVWIQRSKNGNHFLPEPDMRIDNKPLWKTSTIAAVKERV